MQTSLPAKVEQTYDDGITQNIDIDITPNRAGKTTPSSYVLSNEGQGKEKLSRRRFFEVLKNDKDHELNFRNAQIRKDRNGRLILRGSNKHKVTFVDQVLKTEICEVYLVESYKKYNSMSEIGGNENTANCHCSIF
ncbi:UNKNOWN [Stylonychia lemnae]|uniref:Uncharacterized protein n=1 Tax=Stylonychia lemnae TaxID=5949 RepID=A0A078B5H2_STYLE|nr:UNKNOWN [Stylonychia lemnae]|eukprot:CDW88547.1 UNKNOWN [Stylonychia lemnae]